MNRQHVDITAGEDRTVTFTARSPTQALVNLTGGTIVWRVGRRYDCDDNVIQKTGTIVSASGGTFSVALDAADTDDLSGDFRHIGLVTISGDVQAVVSGRFRVRNTIT